MRTKDKATIRRAAREFVGRQMHAFENLVECLMSFGEIGDADARLVAKFYVKRKFVKLDPIDGQARVCHGGFYDKAVIGRALATAKDTTPNSCHKSRRFI